jgi:dienelactone hydrolase
MWTIWRACSAALIARHHDDARVTGVQGSGLSDGDWVTLGAHEVEDLAAAVEHLREAGQTSTIGLWGRSMGAVTAMAYARHDPSVCGIVSI